VGLNTEANKLTHPEKLNSSHQIDNFDSGDSQLNDWLKKRALKNELEGASRTYVVCAGNVVIAYYCLANGAVAQTIATGRVRRNMPDPIPVMVIGRLAVDRNWQGQGIGRGLLRDAILRTLNAAEIAGIRAILVHAISEKAKQFYEDCGFTASPIESMTLMVTIKDACASLGLSNGTEIQ
jgi:GNAT superfamily N-acetyltransferase